MAAAYLKAASGGPAPASPYVSGCSGKLRLTAEQARAVLTKRPGTSSYKCRWCGHLHTSSLSGSTRTPPGSAAGLIRFEGTK